MGMQGEGVLTFTRSALQELDRRAVEEFHIPILVLMENAGRAVAEAVRRHLHGGAKAPGTAGVVVVCGPGNNGGDGLVAARHLANAGVRVEVLLAGEAGKFREASAAQLEIVSAMRLPVQTISPGHAELRNWVVESGPEDVIIDALFGTGLTRRVTGLAAEIIAAMNASRRTILSVDIPSGLDCDTGRPLDAEGSGEGGGGGEGGAVRASETVSFCGLKAGFATPTARQYTGKVTIGDIGAPRALLRELGK